MVSIKALKRYCSGDYTKIENYEEAISDPNVKWECHHRLEEQDYSMQKLKELGLYYKVPPEDLILLTPTEHRRRHNIGKKLAEETTRKISENNAARRPEVKEKISEKLTGKKRPEETKKRISDTKNGKSTRPVICIETGEWWPNPNACSKDLAKRNRIKKVHIVKVIEDGDGKYKGHTYKYLEPDDPDQLSLEL